MTIEEVIGLMAIMFVSFFWGAYFMYALYEKEIRQAQQEQHP